MSLLVNENDYEKTWTMKNSTHAQYFEYNTNEDFKSFSPSYDFFHKTQKNVHKSNINLFDRMRIIFSVLTQKKKHLIAFIWIVVNLSLE